MKAQKELSFKKILMFGFFSFVQVVYHLLVDHILNFPQARAFAFKILGSKIGQDTVIMNVKFFNLHHTGPKGLTIGKECFIGDETLIDLYDKLTIGDQVTIAQRVTIITHQNVGYSNHPLQKYFPKFSKETTIKNGSVIGAGSIILPGITIGSNSFVAAGTVVVKNVPPNTLVAGVPAKVIRKIK